MDAVCIFDNMTIRKLGFLLLLGWQSALSQDRIENFRKQVATSDGTEKIDALNQLAIETSTFNNQESREASMEAYRLSNESGYVKGKAMALLYLSLAETNAGQLKKANDLLFKSIRLSHELKDAPFEGYGYTWLSSNFQNAGMPDSAQYYSIKAGELLEKSNNLYYLTFYYNTLSDFFKLQNQADSQRIYIKKSWTIRKNLPDKRYLAFAGNKLAEFYIQYHDYKTALIYLDSCQSSLGVDTVSNEVIAKIWSNRGVIYSRLSNYKLAEFYLDKAKTFYSQNHFPKELNGLLLRITEIYEETGNYEASLQNGLEALSIAEKNSFNVERTRSFIRLGWTYFNKRNYTLCEKYILQAIESSLNYGLTLEEANAYNLYGLLLSITNPKIAHNYLKKSLTIRKRSKSLAGQAEVYGILGNLAIGESKYDSALFYQLLGLKISLKTPDLIGTAYSLAGVGYTFSKLNNYSQAENYLNQAESLADSIKSGTVMVEILNFRRQIAESKNDLKAYIRYTKAYETLSDSLFRQSESNRVLLSETLVEIQNKNSEILLQRATLENQEKELSLIRWQIILVSAGGVLVIIILLILYSSYKASKKLNFKIIEQNNDLATSQEEIQAQNEELLMANEEISAQRDMIQEQRNHLDLRNHELEDIVEKRTKDLIQYIQQLEQFAFISSHNLRAPIARILGLGNLLEMKGLRDSETIHKALIGCARDLDTVIKDLNAVLDIRQNNQIELTQVMLSEEMQKVRSSLSYQIIANQALIHDDFSEVDQVKTFRPYLQSILMNLISNGLKYRRLDVSPVITIKTLYKDNFVCIQVSDNGMGIDLEKYSDKLFMMYKRFHNHVEGKGLGLYMVKTQIETMGGKIEIESEVNSGTTFHLYFKRERAETTTVV